MPKAVNHAVVVQRGGTPETMLRFDLAEETRLLYRLIRRVRRPVELVPAAEGV